MFWSSLFLISIAQGLFLISLIAYKKSKNVLASKLIITLLVIMVLTNLGYAIIRTPIVNYVPQLFAIPFGMMLLFGPLFYFYSKAVTDASFRWQKKYWLHFIPYFIQLAINLPFLMAPQDFWAFYINAFFSGEVPVRLTEKITFAIQDTQLLIYLILTFRWLRSVSAKSGNAQYIISVSSRIKWVKELAYCFSLFLITVFALYIFVLVNGKYNPITNYVYTIITSCIIYFMAYKMVLKPELIVLDFIKKYKAYKAFDNPGGDDYVQKIKLLLEEKKIFTNPELKLANIADELGLPQHQLSKLINEKFDKSFNDLINEYRVREFITRINDPKFQSYSIFGVALDVGFNTKSAFNSTFKKITGKTPSEFKKVV